MQGSAQDRRSALFNDAALFVTTLEQALTLVSGNIADMDLLARVGGDVSMLLYDV